MCVYAILIHINLYIHAYVGPSLGTHSSSSRSKNTLCTSNVCTLHTCIHDDAHMWWCIYVSFKPSVLLPHSASYCCSTQQARLQNALCINSYTHDMHKIFQMREHDVTHIYEHVYILVLFKGSLLVPHSASHSAICAQWWPRTRYINIHGIVYIYVGLIFFTHLKNRVHFCNLQQLQVAKCTVFRV